MEVKSPNSFTHLTKSNIFLAGSIEQGKATNWQEDLSRHIQSFGFNVLNPRRDNWDSSWTQDISNLEFYRQVKWELDAINYADLVIMYFDPETLSPISLLELGILTSHPRKILVVCPDGFWKKGNVQIVCETFGIAMFNSLEELKDVHFTN